MLMRTSLTRLLPDPTITVLTDIVLPSSNVGWQERKNAGEYDWAYGELTEARFPLTLPAGSRDLFLAHFGIYVRSEEVEAWAWEHGYEVAFIDDLFAVGSHREHRELQQKFLILALGSFADVDGCRRAPFLSSYGAGRSLSLRPYNGGLSDRCHFLLHKVCKPSVA